MLRFMIFATASTIPIAKAIIFEPREQKTKIFDAESVKAVNKWHLYNSFMVIEKILTTRFINENNAGDPDAGQDLSFLFESMSKQIIVFLKEYIVKFRDPRCAKKDIKIVISTFFESLEQCISPSDFFVLLENVPEVYKKVLEDDRLCAYYGDTYYIYLSSYITQKIFKTHGADEKLLIIWRNIMRRMYVDIIYAEHTLNTLTDNIDNKASIRYGAPIEFVSSKVFFDDVINHLNILYKTKSISTEETVGICFSIDLSVYMISYFTKRAKEINENPNFFTHKNSIITDIISHLHVSKDHRKIMNAIHLQKNVRVLFTNQSYKSIAEMLVFTNIDDDKIEKCWDIAITLILIIRKYRRLSATTFANVYKLNSDPSFKPFIPYDLKVNIRKPKFDCGGTKTLMPFNVILGESSFRIIYKNLVLCDKIHEMIDDEIISYFYFFQSNLTPIKIMKLSSICGFSEQDNDGPTNTADESQISKITDVNADNAEEESETLLNPKKANEQPKPTPMRQDTETHSRGKKIKKRNEESTQRKKEGSRQPSDNVNIKQVDKSILPSGAPNVSSKSGSTRSDCKMQKKKDKVPETVVETEISKAMHLDHKRNANIRRGSKTNSAVPANKSSEETQNSNKIEDRASPPPETDIDQLGDYVNLFLKPYLQLQYRQSVTDPAKRDTDNALKASDNLEQSKRPRHNQRGLNPAKRGTDNAREARDNSEQSKKPQPNRSATDVATQSRNGSGLLKRQQNQSKPNKAPQCTDQPTKADVKPRQSVRQQYNQSKSDEASQCTDKSTEATGKSKEGITQQHNQTVTDVAHESTNKSTEATGKTEQSKGTKPKAEKDRQLRQFAESKISSSQDSKNAQMTQPTSPSTFAATVIKGSASPMLHTTAERNCYVETNLSQIADDAQNEPTVQAEALGTSNTQIEPPRSPLVPIPALESCDVQYTGLNEQPAWNRVDNTTSDSKEDNGTVNEADNDDSQSQVVKKVCDQFKTYQSSNGLYSLF